MTAPTTPTEHRLESGKYEGSLPSTLPSADLHWCLRPGRRFLTLSDINACRDEQRSRTIAAKSRSDRLRYERHRAVALAA